MYLNELSSLDFAPQLFFVGWPAAVLNLGQYFGILSQLVLKRRRRGFCGLEEYVNFLLGVRVLQQYVVQLILEVSHEKTLIAVSPPLLLHNYHDFLFPYPPLHPLGEKISCMRSIKPVIFQSKNCSKQKFHFSYTTGASYSWEFGQIPPFRIQLKSFHQLVAAGCKDCLLSICFAYTISMPFPIELKIYSQSDFDQFCTSNIFH